MDATVDNSNTFMIALESGILKPAGNCPSVDQQFVF